jgi:hypothetical protein
MTAFVYKINYLFKLECELKGTQVGAALTRHAETTYMISDCFLFSRLPFVHFQSAFSKGKQ